MCSVDVKLVGFKCNNRVGYGTSAPSGRSLFDRDEELRVPAYVIATINVTNPQQYEEYRRLAGIATAKYGGKFLARGGDTALLEGKLDANRVVIVEYADLETAKRFYDSSEYRAARAARGAGP